MSRLTGSDTLKLMEAYNAIYAPQELTEEQVWEEVEAWVNSLVEEGHDLSEYTWEDMYEAYLNEIGQPGARTTGQATAPISNAPYQSRFARPMNAGTPQRTGRGTAVSRPQIGSLPSSARQVTQYPQGVRTGVGGGNAGASVQPPARPAVRPATRPTATTTTASARPVATAPAAPAAPRPTPTAAVPNAPAAPRPSLAQQTAELRKMRQASQQRQIAQGGTPATPLVQSFDPFDVVMGYLIDEGYAETEEAATVIMANMSEEWREEILEAKSDEGLSRDEKEQVRSERQGGRDRFLRALRNDVMRGKKREKGVKSSYYDSQGNMIRTRYRQQQFKRTGNPLYKD